ncbi:MAG: NAD/NADP octopine/nopaline dehydrogenase family protein [Candidatus Woesearchaeota archaeon]
MNINILGGGNVALATAGYLRHHGNNVTFIRRNKPAQRKRLIVHYQTPDHSFTDNVEITQVPTLSDAQKYDLMLICISAQGHSEVGKTINGYHQNGAPIVFFPGKFASSHLLHSVLDKESNVGEVSSSLFHAEATDEGELEVRIKNKKSHLEYAGVQQNGITSETLQMLKHLFGEDSFVDGVHPIRVALQNHDYTLNSVAILENENVANNSAPHPNYFGPVEIGLYGNLGRIATQTMERIYCVREEIAKKLGFTLSSMEQWLRDLNPNAKADMKLPSLFLNSYFGGKKLINVYTDRRLTEDVPFGLVPLETIARAMNVDPRPVSEVIELANAMYERGQRRKNLQESHTRFDFRDHGLQANLEKYICSIHRK